ncbi:MAG: hypothetical protein ACI9K2_007639, partial [Myxococcota bacterium]
MSNNLLVISDLHLGEGLREGGACATDPRTDAALIAFLEHYTANRADGRAWRLIVNGDAIDFIAVHLMPSDVGVVHGLHADDHHYGLGTREHAAAAKLERVLVQHAGVFRAMAAFVAHGNEIAMVRGNHDAELYWPEVQARLRDALGRAWAEDPRCGTPGTRAVAAVRDAVSFHDWFVYEPGLAWIEHGHQYDPYCSFDHVLEPVGRSNDIEINIGAAIMRYVANRFAGDVKDHWGRGFWGYLNWTAAQGAGRALGVVDGYRAMCARLIQNRLMHWWDPSRMVARGERHRESLRALASRARITLDTLDALHELRTPPIVGDLSRLVRAVMLDRLAVLLLSPWVLALPLLGLPWAWWPVALLVGGAAVIVAAWWAAADRENVDPRGAMRAVSRRIRRLAAVPVVV